MGYLKTEIPRLALKITPAMIAAGARFLRETYEVSSEVAAAQMAESLFSEMVAAAPKRLRKSQINHFVSLPIV
jgi:hypothetical protein